MEYIEFYGLKSHPFLLTPDPKMFHLFGQYYESFEGLKYAMATEKGGALLVSEEAGLGKTTLLLSFIEEMRKIYGEKFFYAFCEYPLVGPEELIGYISSSITKKPPTYNKLKDLEYLRESLKGVKRDGGRAVIVIDEAHLLEENILQELRLLLNLREEGISLFTLILSGQRSLWERIRAFPEFFQRLPIRYFLQRLKFEETKELLRWRLKKAGSEEKKEIFKEEAFEIIHRYAEGIPRTVLVLSDLSLLTGFKDRVGMIGFKEVTKAVNLLKGRNEGYYTLKEVERPNSSISIQRERKVKKGLLRTERFVIYTLLFLLSFFILFVKYKIFERPILYKESNFSPKAFTIKKEEKRPFEKKGVVFVEAARVREAPSLDSKVIAVLFKGEVLLLDSSIEDETGKRWYGIRIFGERKGFIREDLVKTLEEL